MRRFPALWLPAAAVLALCAALFAAPPPAQARTLPVNWDFAAGALAGFASPGTPPPGANNSGCRPSAAHPYPVVLVHGTFANQDDNWQAASPLLANHGYCVFTFNYGGTSPSADFQGTGDIAVSAGQLAAFVTRVLAATGAAKADLVGHSQGGMMPRYYLKFLGGAAHVDKLVALAPSNHGTTLDGLTALVTALGQAGLVNGAINALCTACVQQEVGSPFLTNLNAGGETVAGGDIVFRPGWVLRSIAEGRWLVLDEANRGDLDRIFGALLTWLSCGHVTVGVANYADVVGHLKAGTLRALATTSPTRIEALPDLPTAAEAGHKALEYDIWFGMLAPAKAPKDIVSQLSDWFVSAMGVPAIKAKLVDQGLYPVGACGAEFAAELRRQYADYGSIIRDANIKAE